MLFNSSPPHVFYRFLYIIAYIKVFYNISCRICTNKLKRYPLAFQSDLACAALIRYQCFKPFGDNYLTDFFFITSADSGMIGK